MSESKAFTAIYISVAISYLGVGLVAPLIAIVLAEHGANSLVVGLVGTTMFAAFTLASFPMGAATDRIGPKPILIGGLIVYGISVALFALIENIWLFFAARAIEGVGGAAISVATETMINQLSAPNERARRMSYYALAVGIGWAAGPLLGAFLFEIRPSIPFLFCFAFSMIAAVLAAGLIPRTGSTSHEVHGIFSGLSPALTVPLAAGALYGYLMSSLVTLIPLYFKAMNVGEQQMASIITAVIVGTIISQVPIGHAADRFGKRKTVLVCALVLTAVFAVMPFHSDWKLFLITGALAGALAGSFYPIGLAMIGGLVRKERLGAATALFSLAFGIGSLTGPAVSGFAMKNLGNGWLFHLPLMLTASFALTLIVLYKRSAARARRGLSNLDVA